MINSAVIIVITLMLFISLVFRATLMCTLVSFLSLVTIYRLSLLTEAVNGPVQRRFEYKHSFRAPDLSLRDGTIPFWTITGDAVASNEQLRLAPSMRSRKGRSNVCFHAFSFNIIRFNNCKRNDRSFNYECLNITISGLAWNKRVMAESNYFEIQVAFRVTGQGRIGADGIAVWYTAQQPALGPVSKFLCNRLICFNHTFKTNPNLLHLNFLIIRDN